MLLGRNEVPFSENPHCKRCASKNCRELLVQPLFPGKVIFAHRRQFCSIPDYIPSWRNEENAPPAQEAALTDEMEVTEGAIEISTPTWEHNDEEYLQDYPEKALEGAKIVLSAQVKNYPEGAPVTFDIYDNSESTPLLIKSIKGTHKGGTATAEWVVEDPQLKGDNLKISVEASARSKFSQRSDIPYLAKLKCDFVEMPDVLFNHGSAVPCLDTEGILLGALSAAFIYVKNNPDREAVLFGHTDTSGKPDYNYDLSQWRAEAIQAFINNDVDLFLDTVALASKVEDYQTFLAALAKNHAWKCDPGKIDNIAGEKTKAAIMDFQEEYNTKFNKELKPDGIMGDKTWTALFEVTRSLIEEIVKKECGDIPSFCYGYNGKGIYPCGESFPVDQIGVDGIKSKTNRRVEIVFFEKGKSTELKAPVDKKKVEKKEAAVYDKKKAEIKPIKVNPPKPVESDTIILEFVFPQVYDASKPHKQYVNLPSNSKEQGNELTVKVKAKGLKANTTGKNVYWRVTADNNNSKRNSPKTGIMDKAGGKLVEFTAGIANLDTPFEKNEASIVLACGLAGGDHFTVEAGTDGENFTSKLTVENWRRLWYQLTHHQSIVPPSMATPIENLKKVFIDFLAEAPCKHTKAPAGNVIVGSHNAGEYHKLFSAKNKDRCCHIILCDQQYDGKDSTGNDLVSEATQIFKSKSDLIQMSDPSNKLKIFNPPLQTGSHFLISGKWKNLAKKTKGTFTDEPTKTNSSTGLVSFHDHDFVKVDLPHDANAEAGDSVEVTIKVTAACGPWGGDGSVSPHNLVVINANDTIHSQCVMHELGHIMNMVPDPTYYLCPPGFNFADHTMQYTKMGGSGSHCSYKIDKALSTKTKYVDGRCIMFHQLNYSCELQYCPDCSPFIKAQALTTLK